MHYICIKKKSYIHKGIFKNNIGLLLDFVQESKKIWQI